MASEREKAMMFSNGFKELLFYAAGVEKGVHTNISEPLIKTITSTPRAILHHMRTAYDIGIEWIEASELLNTIESPAHEVQHSLELLEKYELLTSSSRPGYALKKYTLNTKTILEWYKSVFLSPMILKRRPLPKQKTAEIS